MSVVLRQREVGRRFAAVAVTLQVEGHGLAVIQTAQTGTLQRRDVNENVPR